MRQLKYDENLEIHNEDYVNAEVDRIISELSEKDIGYYHDTLSKSATEYIETGRAKDGKVLWLLADACSMMLNPENPNEPFRPFFSGGGRRSALPEDFSTSDIAFFTQILTNITDYQLRARIADICWFMVHPRNPDFAIAAIDAYMEYTFENNAHYHESENPYKRAIYLSQIHRELTRDRLIKIREYLLGILEKNVTNSRIVDIVSGLLLDAV